jgi:Hypoxia induced protein conserved region
MSRATEAERPAALYPTSRDQAAPTGAETMASTFSYLTIAGLAAVFLVLLAGILNMSREDTASLSQKLMRWRVGLQFVAVILIMAAIYFKRGIS